jgi:hypothetical protein
MTQRNEVVAKMAIIGFSFAVMFWVGVWLWPEPGQNGLFSRSVWAQNVDANNTAADIESTAVAPEVQLWLPPQAQVAEPAKELEMRWKRKIYRVPDIQQRRQIVAAMDPLFESIDNPAPSQVQQAAAKLETTGYEISEYSGPEGHWLILQAKGDFAGAGYYMYRTGKLDSELVLQAPHAIFDVHTDVLTKGVFASLPVRAAYFSDYQRYGGKSDKPSDKQYGRHSPYDLAHNPDTLFQDLTIQWMLKRPRTVVVQPHAFALSTVGGEAVDMIVSPGSKKNTSPVFEQMVKGLKEAFPGCTIKIYPNEIRILGGTTNLQGKAVRAAGGDFIHIELSKTMRRLFKQSDEDRMLFGRAILGAVYGSIE